MVKQIMKKSFTENEVSTTQASHNQKTVKLDNQVRVFRKSESRVLFSIFGIQPDRSNTTVWDPYTIVMRVRNTCLISNERCCRASV